MSVDCNGFLVESEWQKIDDKTLKVTLKTQPVQRNAANEEPNRSQHGAGHRPARADRENRLSPRR